MVEYRDLIQTVIDRERTTTGADWTGDVLDEIDGLEVDADGRVTDLSGDPRRVLEDLLDSIEDLTGPVGLSLVARAVTEEFGTDIDLDLPEKLRERL